MSKSLSVKVVAKYLSKLLCKSRMGDLRALNFEEKIMNDVQGDKDSNMHQSYNHSLNIFTCGMASCLASTGGKASSLPFLAFGFATSPPADLRFTIGKAHDTGPFCLLSSFSFRKRLPNHTTKVSKFPHILCLEIWLLHSFWISNLGLLLFFSQADCWDRAQTIRSQAKRARAWRVVRMVADVHSIFCILLGWHTWF